MRTSPEAYIGFVKDMLDRGMLDFSRGASFFVAKKNGKFTLVLDCRATNELFAPPPDIALAAGYAFSQLEISDNENMLIAQRDVKDYFYSIGLPEVFCLPPLRVPDRLCHSGV